METTTIFTSEGSQAVMIPADFRFDGNRVEILRRGSEVVLRALPDLDEWPKGYIESIGLSDDGTPVDDSFRRHPQGEHKEISFE